MLKARAANTNFHGSTLNSSYILCLVNKSKLNIPIRRSTSTPATSKRSSANEGIYCGQNGDKLAERAKSIFAPLAGGKIDFQCSALCCVVVRQKLDVSKQRALALKVLQPIAEDDGTRVAANSSHCVDYNLNNFPLQSYRRALFGRNFVVFGERRHFLRICSKYLALNILGHSVVTCYLLRKYLSLGNSCSI